MSNNGEYKGTVNYNEHDDFEVLYIHPSWHDKGVINQNVCIAPLSEDREISLIASKHYQSEKTDRFIHLVFTEEETNMIIDALIEAKKRWDNDLKIYD